MQSQWRSQPPLQGHGLLFIGILGWGETSGPYIPMIRHWVQATLGRP